MSGPVNAHLFRGQIRGYWKLLARGADRSSVRPPDRISRKFDFGMDQHGFARRTGGIVSPEERPLYAGRHYYRFVSTAAYSKDRAAVLGNWWIDQATWMLMVAHARATGDSLDLLAQVYLALPDEWGDRGRIARCRLQAPILAWCGVGNVARSGSGEAYTPAQHNKAIQMFVPGDPELLSEAFGPAASIECTYTRKIPDTWRYG